MGSLSSIRKWSGWHRVGVTGFALLMLFIAANQPEHTNIHITIGRVIVLIAALVLIIRGKDNYNILFSILAIGIGIIWYWNGEEIRCVTLLTGGLMFLISLFLWWIDKYVSDDECEEPR